MITGIKLHIETTRRQTPLGAEGARESIDTALTELDELQRGAREITEALGKAIRESTMDRASALVEKLESLLA